MNEKLPYEENIKNRLNDLPVPDEDQAWQKMKMLLDDDDDRVPPPIFLRSCMGWGLLLLTGLIIVWLVFHPERQFLSGKKENSKTREQKESKTETTQNSSNTVSSRSVTIKPDSIQTSITSSQSNSRNVPINNSVDRKTLSSGNETTKNNTPGVSTVPIGNKNNSVPDSKRQSASAKIKKENGKIISAGASASFVSKTKKTGKKPGVKAGIKNPAGETSTQTSLIVHESTDNPPVQKTESQPGNKNPGTATRDSTYKDSTKVIVRKADSPVVKKPFVDTTATAASPLLKKYYFSIGIGMYQQLPIAGQKSSPYNIYGRKGSLGDYLPSVYVRYHNREKWLIHAEFRYGAPQNVKEVAYEQQSFTTFDSTGGTVTSITTTNTSTLKKTFYHQIPISFDYFIRPGWSAGAGVVYSKFYSAVSEDESHKKNNFTQAETVDKKIAQTDKSNDSGSHFTKSQVQFTLSTEYTWKRLSGGIRYAMGLQPFIRYTTSSGELKEEKNQSVNVFIRFRLWKGENQN